MLMDLTNPNDPDGMYQAVVQVLQPSGAGPNLIAQAMAVLAHISKTKCPREFWYFIDESGLYAELARRGGATLPTSEPTHGRRQGLRRCDPSL